ncbi:MAG: hypothetical protein ACKO85_02240 [Isosphaeraceae bacterium]
MGRFNIRNLSKLALAALERFKQDNINLKDMSNSSVRYIVRKELLARKEREVLFGDPEGDTPDFSFDEVRESIRSMAENNCQPVVMPLINTSQLYLEAMLEILGLDHRRLTPQQKIRLADKMLMFGCYAYHTGRQEHAIRPSVLLQGCDTHSVSCKIANRIQDELEVFLFSDDWVKLNYIVWDVITEFLTLIEKRKQDGQNNKE